MKSKIESNLFSDDPPSKMTKYLRWARRMGLDPDDPASRTRFEEALKTQELRQKNWKRIFKI